MEAPTMTPHDPNDADQTWFWTPECQESEREADEDVRAGRLIGPFKSIAEIKRHFGDAED